MVADDAGLEWFVCGVHSRPSATARWSTKTALAAWLAAHELPAPAPPLQCPSLADVAGVEVDENGRPRP